MRAPDQKRRGKLLALVALGAGLLVLGLLGGFLALRQKKPEPAELVLSASLSPEAEAALRSILPRFASLHPHIAVKLRLGDQADPAGADLMAGPAHAFPRIVRPQGGPPEVGELVPWTGALWSLAARKDSLERAAAALPAETAALRAGRAGPEDFRRLLAFFKDSGLAPITLGNSHRWPYVLWLQHWAAALVGVRAVEVLPRAAGSPGTEGNEADPYAALRPAMEELAAWRDSGYFNEATWSEGWARGLLPLARGEAAFALVSDEYLAPVPAEARNALVFLPFPRRAGDAAWALGSATYLGILPDSAAPEAAALLLRFLSSPGITQELARLTGKPYFAWDPATGKAPEVTPAWLEAAATPDFEALARAALGK